MLIAMPNGAIQNVQPAVTRARTTATFAVLGRGGPYGQSSGGQPRGGGA